METATEDKREGNTGLSLVAVQGTAGEYGTRPRAEGGVLRCSLRIASPLSARYRLWADTLAVECLAVPDQM